MSLFWSLGAIIASLLALLGYKSWWGPGLNPYGTVVIEENFDGIAYWGLSGTEVVKKGKDGGWCTYAGPGKIFSLKYNQPMSLVLAKEPAAKKIRLTGWVKGPVGGKTVLVHQVVRRPAAGGDPVRVVWDENEVNSVIEHANDWASMQLTFDVPPPAPAGQPENELNIFLKWIPIGPGDVEEVYLDDVRVTAVP